MEGWLLLGAHFPDSDEDAHSTQACLSTTIATSLDLRPTAMPFRRATIYIRSVMPYAGCLSDACTETRVQSGWTGSLAAGIR